MNTHEEEDRPGPPSPRYVIDTVIISASPNPMQVLSFRINWHQCPTGCHLLEGCANPMLAKHCWTSSHIYLHLSTLTCKLQGIPDLQHALCELGRTPGRRFQALTKKDSRCQKPQRNLCTRVSTFLGPLDCETCQTSA